MDKNKYIGFKADEVRKLRNKLIKRQYKPFTIDELKIMGLTTEKARLYRRLMMILLGEMYLEHVMAVDSINKVYMNVVDISNKVTK